MCACAFASINFPANPPLEALEVEPTPASSSPVFAAFAAAFAASTAAVASATWFPAASPAAASAFFNPSSAVGTPSAASALGGGVSIATPRAPASASGFTPAQPTTPLHPSRGGANVGTEIFPATAATTSSLGATIRSAPSFAATNAPLASVTLHATIADDAARDLRATTTGTPSSLRRTPSASAEGRSIQAIVGVEFKGVRWS